MWWGGLVAITWSTIVWSHIWFFNWLLLNNFSRILINLRLILNWGSCKNGGIIHWERWKRIMPIFNHIRASLLFVIDVNKLWEICWEASQMFLREVPRKEIFIEIVTNRADMELIVRRKEAVGLGSRSEIEGENDDWGFFSYREFLLILKILLIIKISSWWKIKGSLDLSVWDLDCSQNDL